jgi:hypothetical protein
VLGRWQGRGKRNKAESAPRSHDPAEPDYWRRLPVGSSVVLRDFQALEENAATGGSVDDDGINYEVVARRNYVFRGGGGGLVAEYVLFDIEGAEQTYQLVALLGGASIELRVYYRPDGFEPASRGALLDQGFAWLFEEPKNLDNFVPYDLEFANHPDVPPIEDGGEEKELDFAAVASSPLYGEYQESSTGRNVPVVAVEYRTDDPCSNPLMLVLEEGGLDRAGDPVPDGGFISLYLGSPIDLSQMDIYAV